MHLSDLGNGDQLLPEYVAMSPDKQMPVLENNGFVLSESNAILFYLATQKWESAHWDSEACGVVGYEKVSKSVLGLGTAEPALVARGEQNFIGSQRS
jgi:glutathione S-transferase